MDREHWTLKSTWRYSKVVNLSHDETEILWRYPFAERGTESLDERVFFEDFVELASDDASPADFLRFAKRSGPMLICEHELPATHIDVSAGRYIPGELIDTHQPEVQFGRRVIVERVSTWRSLAQQGHAMLAIAHDLRRGVEVELKTWEAVRPLVPTLQNSVATKPLEGLAVQRRALALAVQTWLDWSDARVTYTWDDELANTEGRSIPSARIGASSFFGSLALSLTLAIARAPRFEVCTGCGKSFTPKRPRDHSKRIWCDSAECAREKNRREVRRSRAK